MGGCQQDCVLVDVAHRAGDRCARAANHGGDRHEAEDGRGDGEMPEIIVVSDAVEGISPRERVQQRTPEQIEDVPHFREETVEVGRLVLQERVQQRSAEKLEVVLQSPEETVEVVEVWR